jgi:glycosyltransferase involved in cell wall biosynthesis
MKVAYILPSIQKPGGWRTHAVAFLKAIRHYVEPLLFVSAADYETASSLFPGDKLYRLPTTQQAWLAQRSGALRLARSYLAIFSGRFPAVKLVHSLEAYPSGLIGSWLAQKLRCPHVITTHGTYGLIWYEYKADRSLYERVLKKTALVCPVSQGTAELLHTYFGGALKKTRVHPVLNGNDFYKTIKAETALYRQPSTPPILLTVGDVKPRKGQHLSLAAFARIKERYPETRYHIVGLYKQNDYYRQLQQFIASKDLQDVTFLGAISDEALSREYQGASVFVLTPQQEGLHFEGFGLVYLEAGAYGLPVVGTHTGGVPDAVQEGVTGFLAKPGDVNGIAAAILRLLNDPELALQVGRANRRRAEQLTWERSAQEQMQAYQEIIGDLKAQ